MKNLDCECGGQFGRVSAISEEGAHYEAYRCNKCSEELLDMQQAEKFYHQLEKIYSVKLSKWGESLALRIPASVARSLHLKPRQKARIIQEDTFFKVVPF